MMDGVPRGGGQDSGPEMDRGSIPEGTGVPARRDTAEGIAASPAQPL